MCIRDSGEDVEDEENAHEAPNQGIILLSNKLFQISVRGFFLLQGFCFQHSNEL